MNKLRLRGFEPHNLRFRRPMSGNAKGLINKAVTGTSQSNLAPTLEKHSRLMEVVEVWPKLPAHIKAAIMALVQTHINAGESE